MRDRAGISFKKPAPCFKSTNENCRRRLRPPRSIRETNYKIQLKRGRRGRGESYTERERAEDDKREEWGGETEGAGLRLLLTQPSCQLGGDSNYSLFIIHP